jgi:glycosyltransferase involved in cell wall biosynthesis
MNSPLISILMTSYNVESFITEAIESVLNQTYTNWELLIADDCSEDDTRTIIGKFTDPRIRTFHNSHNLHYLRTRNKLVEQAKGDFITFMDADDSCAPTRLERQLKEFSREPGLGMCGCLVRYVDKYGDELPIQDSKPTDYQAILNLIKSQNVFTGPTIMVRSNVWKAAGGYRDFFNSLGYEDYDLTSRIVEEVPAINLAERLYFYRQYPESTSRKDLLFHPFKLHGDKLVQLLINERQETGSDSLERGDYSRIINYVMELHRPYVEDPSTIYRHFMWANLNKRLTTDALKSSMKAIWIKPFSWANWKTLILYFLVRIKLVKG